MQSYANFNHSFLGLQITFTETCEGHLKHSMPFWFKTIDTLVTKRSLLLSFQIETYLDMGMSQNDVPLFPVFKLLFKPKMDTSFSDIPI